MSKLLQQLEETAIAARRALTALEVAKNDEERALIDAAKETIRKEMSAKHDPAIRNSRAAVSAAELLLNNEKDRIARTGEGGPFPVGTKVAEWEQDRWSRKWKAPVKFGVIECITRDSLHAGNVSDWSRAKLGEFVIRHLKKDGTPSAKYTIADRGWRDEGQKLPYGWYLDGVHPDLPGAQTDSPPALATNNEVTNT